MNKPGEKIKIFEPMTNTAFLLTGSNMGNRLQQLETARRLLHEECGRVVQASPVYETAAWGLTDQPAFLNQALELRTSLTARQLMRRMLKVEKQMGRVRKEKYGPRVTDIDMLLFNEEVHDYPLLKLPHPELANRRFALMPLADIAGKKIHPLKKITVLEMLSRCPDPLEVTPYS